MPLPTTAAFAAGRPPGQTVPEARLIDELRAGPAWLPALSLVALTPAGEVIGHVLGTRGLRGTFTYPEPFDRT